MTQAYFPSSSVGPNITHLSQPITNISCSGNVLPASAGIDRKISALATSSKITSSDSAISTVKPSGPRRRIRSGRNSVINPFFMEKCLDELPPDDMLISQEDWNHLFNNIPPSVSDHERLFIFCASIYGTRSGIFKAKINGWKYRRILHRMQYLIRKRNRAMINP